MDAKYFTAGELRRRGWTELLIRQFAGLPDDYGMNPHYPAGPVSVIM